MGITRGGGLSLLLLLLLLLPRQILYCHLRFVICVALGSWQLCKNWRHLYIGENILRWCKKEEMHKSDKELRSIVREIRSDPCSCRIDNMQQPGVNNFCKPFQFTLRHTKIRKGIKMKNEKWKLHLIYQVGGRNNEARLRKYGKQIPTVFLHREAWLSLTLPLYIIAAAGRKKGRRNYHYRGGEEGGIEVNFQSAASTKENLYWRMTDERKGGERFSGPSFSQRDNRSGRNICFYRKKLTMTKSHLFFPRGFFCADTSRTYFFSLLRRPRQIRFTHVFPFASAAYKLAISPCRGQI